MSNVLRIALADPVDASREAIKRQLLAIETIWLEAECSRYEFFPDVAEQSNPDACIVSLDADEAKGLSLIERLRRELPQSAILAVSSKTDGQIILKAVRAGAREYLPYPIDPEDLASALERIAEIRFGTSHGGARGSKVVAVAGATGGVGCTSLAVNLACILASHPGNTVVLVDLDLAIGDADVFLDTIPDYTLLDVAENVSRLDFQLLKKSLTKHSSGLYLLPRPVELRDLALITPESLRRVFGLLKATFSHIVLDLSKGYTETDMAALEFATDVLMVVQLDLPCLRNLVRIQLSWDEQEALGEKLRIVVNRVGLESGQIKLKKAKETIGREIFAQIPNDYRTMVEMRNNGIPLIDLAPKAPITKAMQELAERLTAPPDAAEQVSEEGEEDASATGNSWFCFWPKSK
ncbi:MAG: pilus assembly protein CpaE [Pirellulaceae bacterium]|nr:MAG: pilus assembly protein CpaE [Pirellulaceae bacterium]